MENVPGLFSSQNGADFAVIIRGLEKLGYMGAWKTFDSQYFGVAQRRRRVFIIGHLGKRCGSEILFDGESLQGNPAEGRKTWESVAGTIGGSSQSGGFRTTDLDNNGAFVVVTETGAGFWSEGKPRLRCSSAPTQPQTIIAFHTRQDPCSNYERAYSLESSTPQSNAIVFKDNIMYKVRRLTPKECERLQGFPDDWTKYGRKSDGTVYEQSDTQRYRQLGNAVTVSVAEWLGSYILNQHSHQENQTK